jgi:hypothetical protein
LPTTKGKKRLPDLRGLFFSFFQPKGRVEGRKTQKYLPSLFAKKQEGKEVINIPEDTIFVLTREDVIGCAKEMGISEDAITDDVLEEVKKA